MPKLCVLRPSWHPRVEPDVLVPADLSTLTGPTRGVIDPPVHLYWQPGTIDLASDAGLRKFYTSAIGAASTSDDFGWINAAALARLWPRLAIASRIRRAWETIHPELRGTDVDVNARLQIQDVVLAAIADIGFALAGGSALLDYDIITRDTEDIDAFLDSTAVAAFTAAVDAVVAACRANGWTAQVRRDQDWDKTVEITSPAGATVVQLVHHQRSRHPESRAGGGLRLVFDDVVGGKAVATADAPRGRDFDDLAHILDTPGWTLQRIVEAMARLGYPDKVEDFHASIERFRRGDYDQTIRDEGFDPRVAHARLDELS